MVSSVDHILYLLLQCDLRSNHFNNHDIYYVYVMKECRFPRIQHTLCTVYNTLVKCNNCIREEALREVQGSVLLFQFVLLVVMQRHHVDLL